ncbi:hypothetical protein MRX96_014298 [Rhipicephalus microplus]
MAVPFISFLLLPQARVVISPLGGDVPADSTDGTACGLHDAESVLRWLLPAATDLQKCPARTELDFSSRFSCQAWTLGGAGVAGDMRIGCSGTPSTGHGTGDMAVHLISFVLLTQAAPRLEAAIVRCSSSTECCQEFPAADPDRSGWNPTLQVPDSASVFDLKIPPTRPSSGDTALALVV